MKKVILIFDGLARYSDGTTVTIHDLPEEEQENLYREYNAGNGIFHTENHDRPIGAIKTPPTHIGSAQPEPQPDSTTEPLPTIPESVFEAMPDFLRRLCSYFPDKVQRDVFITGALPAIAAQLPNVRSPNAVKLHTPDLYCCVVASFATGKGILEFSRRLVSAADTEALVSSKSAFHEWKKKTTTKKGSKENPPDEVLPPMPIVRGVIIPADSSAAAFRQRLFSAPRGLIFESEADTIVQTLKKEWGSYSDVLRKGFHHETVSAGRLQKADNPEDVLQVIECPQLSVCLSGTPEQVHRLLGSNGMENGLFSRFIIYSITGSNEWKTSRPSSNFDERDTILREASEQLNRLRKWLVGAPEIIVSLTPTQFDLIDKTFSELKTEWYAINPVIAALTHRFALIAQRIAVIFQMLDYANADDHTLQRRLISQTVRDSYVSAAVEMTCCYFEHSTRFASAVTKGGQDKTAEILRLHTLGKSLREIETDTGVPYSTVRRMLAKSVSSVSLFQVKQ